ncbi:hypothetical protein EYF80_051684 [Liparis tanakae]|uniref:Uncharacterized protein n=1 Tax=Liparis tanakae TaxID=230148 RepID=A0A4Z2FA78_9TELE|nr:hypothetical protein EYF80_051684 [Liparis tanakae]
MEEKKKLQRGSPWPSQVRPRATLSDCVVQRLTWRGRKSSPRVPPRLSCTDPADLSRHPTEVMSVNSSSSSSLTANSSSINFYDFFLKCSDTSAGIFSVTAFIVTLLLLILPLCVYVIYLGFQRWRQQRSGTTMSHSDVFTFHMVVVELFFHTLTCVERYLAVVHPVTYLGLKKGKGIRLRNISIGSSSIEDFLDGLLTWEALVADKPPSLRPESQSLPVPVVSFKPHHPGNPFAPKSEQPGNPSSYQTVYQPGNPCVYYKPKPMQPYYPPLVFPPLQPTTVPAAASVPQVPAVPSVASEPPPVPVPLVRSPSLPVPVVPSPAPVPGVPLPVFRCWFRTRVFSRRFQSPVFRLRPAQPRFSPFRPRVPCSLAFPSSPGSL